MTLAWCFKHTHTHFSCQVTGCNTPVAILKVQLWNQQQLFRPTLSLSPAWTVAVWLVWRSCSALCHQGASNISLCFVFCAGVGGVVPAYAAHLHLHRWSWPSCRGQTGARRGATRSLRPVKTGRGIISLLSTAWRSLVENIDSFRGLDISLWKQNTKLEKISWGSFLRPARSSAGSFSLRPFPFLESTLTSFATLTSRPQWADRKAFRRSLAQETFSAQPD